MASLDLARLMNNARVHLPGAIDTNIQLELFNVLNDFFQDSDCWQEKITFPVVAGADPATVYSIEQSSVSSIVRLLRISNGSDKTVGGDMETPGEIVLNSSPGQSDTYTALVSLTVDDPVTKEGYPEFPAWALSKYNTGILDGLVGRMMMQPAKPFTNAQMSIYHTRCFNQTVSQAKFEALHKNVKNGQTWRFPQTFAARPR